MRHILRLSVLAWVTTVLAAAQCGLLSWDEYKRERHSFPYVLQVGTLTMFGVRHTRDPRDPQLAEIERLWREVRPQLAFSEGGIRPPSADRDEAVRRYGEPGFLRFLCDRDHVPLRDIEPPRSEETAALAARFGADGVKQFYSLRIGAAPGDPRFDPTQTGSFLNDIARASSEYRNCHIVPMLVKEVRGGKRVFVVIGGSHVIVQEKALRSALANQ